MSRKKKSAIDKAEIIRQLCEALAAQERATSAAAASAADAATHEESQPETDKDTFALEASYLAGAHAARVRELAAQQKALKFLPVREFSEDDAIDLGAVVTVEYDDKTAMYFLAPHAGGTKVTVGKQLLTAITPDSPLGAQLIGRRVGDEVRINKSAGEITTIA